jgi:hypothetical protein
MKIKYDNKDYFYYLGKKNNEGVRFPFHNDRKMIKILINVLNNCNVFIETGTFIGGTTYFVAKNFPNLECYSCESNKQFYDQAMKELKDLNNLKVDLIPSPQGLYNIKKEYDNNVYEKYTCFWLDAHWKSDPLYDELRYITTNFKKFCIFIDDFTIPWDKGFGTDGYGIEKIKPFIINKDKLKYYMPNYSSSDKCFNKKYKSEAVGYIVITNMDINKFNNLKEISL